MSEALPKTRPVTGSEWMIFIRDYQIEVTANEFAVGSLYGTCGNWGQRVYLSDVAVADILHIKRDTAAKARKGLLAKGLIEDIGQHGSQPQQREYRLTVPVEMPGRRRVKGDVPETGTPCPPNGHPHVPETGTGVSPDRAQHLELELEQELASHHQEPGDDVSLASPSGEDRGGDPHTPQDSGEGSPADGEAVEPDWTGDGENATDNRAHLAELLGVPASSIGAPLWRWLEGLGMDSQDDTDLRAFLDAADRAAQAENPVGYFRQVLPVYLERFRAQREKDQAQADAAIIAGEIESYRDKLITETGFHPSNVDSWINEWRVKKHLNDEQVRNRLRFNLEKRMARQAA